MFYSSNEKMSVSVTVKSKIAVTTHIMINNIVVKFFINGIFKMNIVLNLQGDLKTTLD